MSESVLLQLRDVGKDYQATDDGEVLTVLAGTNLSVNAGETIAIVGPSGCGKSTMLNLIGALDSPTAGSVSLDGEDLDAANEKHLADLRNRKIGFIFQSHHLLPQCSVLENVLVPVIARGPADEESVERARRLLKRVGLGERLNHRPGQLSGGERQRVAVVRALINQPKMVLADEPTGALDRNSAETLATLLLELNEEEKVTLIVVTHSLDLARKMGRTLELRDGKLEELQ